MFSIDLLKGKGLPEQIDLKRSVLKALPIVIPILAITAFASVFQQDKMSLRDQQSTLKNNQQQIELHAKDVAEYNTAKRHVNGMKKCLNDISRAMAFRIQISEVLVELVQSLPKEIFIYEMTLDRNSVMEKVEDPKTGTIKPRLVVRRKMDLVICGHHSEKSDAAVQNYVNALKQSTLMTTVFSEIKPSARQQGEVDGQSAIYYEIECTLKEQSQE